MNVGDVVSIRWPGRKVDGCPARVLDVVEATESKPGGVLVELLEERGQYRSSSDGIMPRMLLGSDQLVP
jgi:hypothetical protein